MGNLHRKLQGLQERFYCPIHRDEPLLCSECDIMEFTDEEWNELARLLEQAGFLDQGPCPSAGTCWHCGEGALACLECVSERGEPPGVALLRDADRDRLLDWGRSWPRHGYSVMAEAPPPTRGRQPIDQQDRDTFVRRRRPEGCDDVPVACLQAEAILQSVRPSVASPLRTVLGGDVSPILRS